MTTPTLALCLKVTDEIDQYSDVRGRRTLAVKAEVQEFQDGRMRSPGGAFEDLDDLVLSGQGESNYPQSGCYGWDVEYRSVFSVDLPRAQGMVKVLAKLKRKLDKMNMELGYSATFPAYVLRVALALGIKKFLVIDRPGNLRGVVAEIREMTATQASDWLTREIASFFADKSEEVA